MAENNNNNEYLRKVHERVGQKYAVGSFDSFVESLKNPEKRKKAYDYLSDKYIMDDFSTFDNKIKGLVGDVKPTQQSSGSYIGDVAERLGAGAANFAGGALTLAQKVADKGLFSGVGLAGKLLGAGNIYGKGMGKAGEYLKNKGEEWKAASDRYKGKTFFDLAKEGRYGEAIGDLFLGATESLPVSLGIMATGGTGLAAAGAVTASEKYDELRKQNPNMSEAAALGNSVVTGISEAVSEMLGPGVIGKTIKGLYMAGGKKAAAEAMEKGIMDKLTQFVDKHWLTYPIVEEGLTEAVNAAVEYGVDRLTGIERTDDFLQTITEAAGYGAAGGAQFTPVVGGFKYMNKRRKDKATRSYNDNLPVGEQLLGENLEQFNAAVTRFQNENRPEQIQNFVNEVARAKGLDNEQTRSLIDYTGSLLNYNNYINSVQDQIEEETRKAYDEIDRTANRETNTVMLASMSEGSEPVYVTGGNLVLGNDGQIDYDNSSSTIYYLDENGKVKQGTPQMFATVVSNTPVETLYTEAALSVNERITQQEDNDIRNASFNNGDNVVLPTGETGVVQQYDDDGNLLVNIGGEIRPVAPEGVMNAEEAATVQAEQQAQQEVAEQQQMEMQYPRKGEDIDYAAITDPNMYASALQSEFGEEAGTVLDEMIADKQAELEKASKGKDAITRRRATNKINSELSLLNEARNIITPVQTEEVIEQVNDNVTEPTPVSEDIEAATAEVPTAEETLPEQETQPAEQPLIPTDEQGVPQYHLTSIDNTLDDLLDGSMSIEEVNSFVDENIKAAESELKEVEKRKPVMGISKFEYLAQRDAIQEELNNARQKVEYWNNVKKEITPEEQGSQSLDKWMMEEPMNLQELAAQMLASGRLKLLQSDYKKQTGYGNREARKMFGIFASEGNGGVSLEKAGEIIELRAREEGLLSENQEIELNSGFEALMDVLTGSSTKGDINSYVANNRERILREEREYQEGQEAAIAEQAYGMSLDDYRSYVDATERNIRQSQITDEQYNELQGEIYDEMMAREQEFYEEIDEALEAERQRETEQEVEQEEYIENESREFDSINQGSDELLPETQINQEGRSNVPQESEQTAADIVGEDGATQGNEVASAIRQDENLLDFTQRVVDADTRAKEEQKVEQNPTDAQKEAGNYKKGHIKVDGLDITIEQPKGSVRSGKDRDGKKWSVTMNNTYGYIRGTKGVDGDHIDVFLSDDTSQGNVYVVDQINSDGSFDEHKVMYGFPDIESAKNAYLSNYSQGWQGLGNITEVSKEDFKKWIDSSVRKSKPFAEYKGFENNAKQTTSSPIQETEMEMIERVAKEQEKKATVQPEESFIGFENKIAEVQQKIDAAYDEYKAAYEKFMQDKNESTIIALTKSQNKVSDAIRERLRLQGLKEDEIQDKINLALKETRKRIETKFKKEQDVKDPSIVVGKPSLSQKPKTETTEQKVEQANNPLTKEEIQSSQFDQIVKDGALSYLNGNINFATSLAYQQIYNDVRNRTENIESDSSRTNAAQLDEGINDVGSTTGRPSRAKVEQMDKPTSEQSLSEQPDGGKDSSDGDNVPVGKPGDAVVSDETTGDDRVSSRPSNTGRGSRTGRKGDNVRTGKRSRVSNKPTKKSPKSDSKTESERADIINEINGLLDDFVAAGKGNLSLSIVGMNPKQIEIAGKILVAGVKLGYTYIKDGIYKVGEWRETMREKLSTPFKQAMSLTDAEVDEFINDMWEYPYTIDGETRLLKEWAAIREKEELRKNIRSTLEEKIKAQKDAEKIPVKTGDLLNIAETLPFLLPQQQEDVYRAEVQFFDQSHNDREHAYGKGYMFTNGTGTGKTYTGLGIVKRFIKQGKKRILIVTPSQAKVTDWIEDAKNLGIELSALQSTSDKGKGAVITTFANLRANKKIMEDSFDLVVYDESHRIMESKSGTTTVGAIQHYMITNKDEESALSRLQLNNKEYLAWQDAQKKLKEKESEFYAKIKDSGRSTYTEEQKEELKRLREDIFQKEKKYMEVDSKLREEARSIVPKTKTVFLSATPFNTLESLAYTEGYIFSYPKENPNTVGGYKHKSPRTLFYEQFFGAGYRFRYGRLEKSVENAEALAQQEVQFSDYLENQLGTKSGRIIDSEYDYSRDFPTVTFNMAPLFNQALSDVGYGGVKEFAPLTDSFYGTFYNYNYSTALFETMKVAAIIPRIKEHLAMGRKVVIFHRRVSSKEPLVPPFHRALSTAKEVLRNMPERTDEEKNKKKAMARAISLFEQKYAKLLAYEKTLNYEMPREQIAKEFGNDKVLYFSGQESTKVKNEAVREFNKGDSGKDILVVQEASGKEGISLHDTKGDHQRVLINLALPQSPITALQIEGRIYRIGNKSNAIFEYPLLGLNLETILFGQKFNQLVSTTENLALGSSARNLRTSFAEGVLQHSGDRPLDKQGVGGKDFDNEGKSKIEPFDKSVLDYYGTQKLRGKRDERAGIDYFPTPEPIGFKMSEWARLTEGEDVLEPSAGHGAIARYVPRNNSLVAIEPSSELFSQLQLRAGGIGRKFVDTIFEDYNIVNKFDAVLMNPPYGKAGATAISHLDKGFKHLNEGGRLIAIIPRGTTDSKFEKWLKENQDAVFVSEVLLPSVTFGRAGTSVNTRVVIVDKVSRKEARLKAPNKTTHDLTYVKDIDGEDGLFNAIRNIESPKRTIDQIALDIKNAKKTQKDFKDIKSVEYVNINEEGILITGRYFGINLNKTWKDLKNPFTYMNFKKTLENLREIQNPSKKDEDRMAFCDTVLHTIENVTGKTEQEIVYEWENKGKSLDSDSIRYRESRFTPEEQQIISKAQANGTYMKAPNGNDTNLTEKQWAQVRTKAFKDWFGDWEGDPENASKVVDENGEPMVVYHGTPVNGITEFNSSQKRNRGEAGLLYFTDNRSVADEEFSYQRQESDRLMYDVIGDKGVVYDVYLNLKNPLDFNNLTEAQLDEISQDNAEATGLYEDVRNVYKSPNKALFKSYMEATLAKLGERGYDGFIYDMGLNVPANEYGVINANQIKSATDNTGTFSAESDDIRFRENVSESNKARVESQRKQAVIDELSNSLNTPITVYNSLEEIVDENPRRQRNKRAAKGWYDYKTGEVFVVMPNNNNAADTQATILHEVVAHKGLRGLLGENFETMMDNIFKNVPKNVRQALVVEALSLYNGNVRTATEEYLARIAERGIPEPSIWGKIKSAIKEVFRNMGINLVMTDEDIAYLLWKSKNRLNKGDSFKTMLDKAAKDAEMRSTLLYRNSSMRNGTMLNTHPTQRVSMRNTINTLTSKLTPVVKNGYKAFREGYQDRMLPLRDFQEAITEETGHKVADFENAYVYDNTVQSKTQYDSNKYKDNILKPLVAEIAKLSKVNGKVDSDKARLVESYMMIKHGLERNALMRERDLAKIENPSPETIEKYRNKDYSGLTALSKEVLDLDVMDEAALTDWVNDFEKSNNTSKLWSLVKTATEATLDKLYQSNMLSRDKMNELKGMYKYYIPLKEWDETTAGEVFDYVEKGYTDKVTNPIKKAKGRTSRAGSVLANMVNDFDNATIIGYKNLMKLRLANLVRNSKTNKASVSNMWYVKTLDNEGNEVWEPAVPEGLTEDAAKNAEIIADFEEKMNVLAENGEAKHSHEVLELGMPIKNWQERQHMIRVKEGGRDMVVYINGDPKVSQAVNGLNRPSLDNSMLQGLNWVKRNMMLNYTSRNINFIARNFIRDMVYTNTMNFVKYGAKFELEYAKNIIPALKALSKRAMGKKAANAEEQKMFDAIDAFERGGGKTGYVEIVGYDKYKREVDKLLRKSAGGNVQVKDVINTVGSFLEQSNDVIENTARFATYLTAKKVGMTELQAIRAAKDVSVNFNRKGSGAMGGIYFQNFYFFFNAAIQGTHNFLSAVKAQPKRAAAAMAMWGTMGFAYSMLMSLLMGDDDEYNQIPDYVRQNNLLIPIPSTEKFALIPLPVELRILFGAGDMFAQASRGEYKGRDFTSDMMAKIMEFSPKSFEGNLSGMSRGLADSPLDLIMKNFTPDAVRPIVDALYFNENFFGKRVSGRNEFNKYVPEFQKVTTGTSKALIKASEKLNEVTGGDYATKGSIDPVLLNPSIAEYLFEQYFGGIGKLISQIYKTSEGAFGDGAELRNIPVVSGLSYDTTNLIPRDYTQKRYDNFVKFYEEAQSRKRMYEKGLFSGEDLSDNFKAFVSDKDYMKYSVIDRYKKIIDSMYDKAKLPMSDDEKKRIFENVRKLKKEMVKQIDKIDNEE